MAPTFVDWCEEAIFVVAGVEGDATEVIALLFVPLADAGLTVLVDTSDFDEGCEDTAAVATQLELRRRNGAASEGFLLKKAPAKCLPEQGLPAAHGLVRQHP